jgi:murein DD-endopeptidase MepM/ murein hydrolase activator NlpD
MNKDIKDIIQSFDLMLGDNKSIVNEVALASPLDKISVNSGFGQRWGRLHNGVDLAANAIEVKSPADGVVDVGAIKNDSCGGTIIISHAGGYKTGYCHMQKIIVKPGDTVKQGQVIGISGGGKDDIGRGRSDGRHLHFTLRKDGKVVDPMDYINKTGVVMTGSVPQATTHNDTTTDDATDNTTSGTTTTTKPEEDDIETKFIKGIAGQLGLKEEKLYSNLGNRTSSSFGRITIPSTSNSKIKSPVNGVVNNYHSDSSCDNQITIQHNFEGHSYYLQFCGITEPEVRDGQRVSKGTVLGNTSSDVIVSVYNRGWERINIEKMLNKEIDQAPPMKKIVNKSDDDNDDKDKGDKKEKEYYDPYGIWFFNKVKEKMPSISKGGEPKISNFFNKYGLSGKKVNENIERIKKLLY